MVVLQKSERKEKVKKQVNLYTRGTRALLITTSVPFIGIYTYYYHNRTTSH
jgi:hypothetical protein